MKIIDRGTIPNAPSSSLAISDAFDEVPSDTDGADTADLPNRHVTTLETT